MAPRSQGGGQRQESRAAVRTRGARTGDPDESLARRGSALRAAEDCRETGPSGTQEARVGEQQRQRFLSDPRTDVAPGGPGPPCAFKMSMFNVSCNSH